MKTDDSEDLLDKYLKGEQDEMPDMSRENLDGQISNENLKGLQALFEQERNREIISQAEVREDLVDMLRSRKRTQPSVYQSTWFRVAASVSILVIAFFAFYFFNLHNNRYVSIYDKYYSPYAIASNTRGEHSSHESVITLYEQERFNEVINHFKENPLVANRSDLQAIILGISYLNTDQTDEAIVLFESTQYFHHTPYTDYSRWYLALAYLKTGDVEEAKTTLRTIDSQQMIHQETARELLRVLE